MAETTASAVWVAPVVVVVVGAGDGDGQGRAAARAMLVLDRVADDDVDALADGEPVEVGAGVELDLVGDDAGAALPGRSERPR